LLSYLSHALSTAIEYLDVTALLDSLNLTVLLEYLSLTIQCIKFSKEVSVETTEASLDLLLLSKATAVNQNEFKTDLPAFVNKFWKITLMGMPETISLPQFYYNITKVYFKYFYTFPCNLEHFYCIGAIIEQKKIFKLFFKAKFLMYKMRP